MPDSEFVMTYPCFFVRDERGTPDVVQFDDLLCACLFTDANTVQTFYHNKHGRSDVWLKICVMKSAAELLHVLKEWQPQFREHGILSIAFDVSPGRRPMHIRYVDLMDDLQRH